MCRYYISQQLTDKSDVYSFGVILLELISGQEAISNEKFGANCRNIVQWVSLVKAKKCLNFGDMLMAKYVTKLSLSYSPKLYLLKVSEHQFDNITFNSKSYGKTHQKETIMIKLSRCCFKYVIISLFLGCISKILEIEHKNKLGILCGLSGKIEGKCNN